MREEKRRIVKPEVAPRVAASSYLNSAPLIWSFAQGPHRDSMRLLTDAAPARCADLLARGQVEAALVPVIEYQRLPEVAIVPHVCVGARREVRSVLLVTRAERRLEDVRSVALDTSSRTSAALVEIIFREFINREPQLIAAEPDLKEMLARNDAALVIGDPAMTFAREGLRVYDMAALWRQWTGHGFVFAMWMAHEGAGPEVLSVDFAGARDEGLAHVDEIVEEYARSLGLPRSDLVSYLLDHICFDPDADMLAGLELYFRLAHRHGLIAEPRPLKLLGTQGA